MSSVTDSEQDLLPTTIPTMMKYPHIKPLPIADDGKKHQVPANCPAPYNPDQTQSVLRRNARERNRVKQVNDSFARLRHHIPQQIIADLTKGGGRGPQKKISKVDTLRIAVEYIKRLQDLLGDRNGESSIQQQHNPAQNNTNCDSASNSSFSSSLSTASSSPANTPIYLPTCSPFPSVLETNLQVTSMSNYNNSTALLSPISLNSYSPPHHTTPQIENSACHTPTSSYNSNITYDQIPQPVQDFEQQYQQKEQASPVHVNGNFQLKFEPYDNFQLDDGDCPAEDDEDLLDYISLWQEQ